MLALKSRDKKGALRHARRLKVLTTSKEKCETFMDRIDEVLTAIADAEATRKVRNACLYCSACRMLTSKEDGHILTRPLFYFTGFYLNLDDAEIWTWTCRLLMP